MVLPRMTTRRWMIAVAMAAVLTFLGLETKRLMRLRRDYLLNAANYQGQKVVLTVQSKQILCAAASSQMSARINRLASLSGQAQDPVHEMMRAEAKKAVERFERYALRFQAEADHRAAQAAYYGRLEAKYRLAARRPWLPIPRDPPEPE